MNNVKRIEDALTEYVSVLDDSLGHTSYANDRHIYVGHLAAAAIMYAMLHRGEPLSRLKEKVAEERHNYGWGYLQGSEGEGVEAAFDKFASFIESL